MTAQPQPGRRSWIVTTTALTGVSMGLTALLYRLTRQHGETLLEMDELRTRQPAPAEPQPANPRQYLFDNGAPTGSVGMNFDLPSTAGEMYSLTQFKGQRVLLIFISPDCPESLAMLPALTQFPAVAQPGQPRIVVISAGEMDRNRQLVEHYQIQVPVLVQERNDVSLLYFINATPMAYLLDANGVTEASRIEGALSILGAAFASSHTNSSTPTNQMTSAGTQFGQPLVPLQRADALPDLQFQLLDGEVQHTSQRRGRRTLYVFFDPLSAPCVDLLPDLTTVHQDPVQPEVLLITRRDPELTRSLAQQHDMSYPIAVQEHWELSRATGTLAAPAAFVVSADCYLETDIAVGQQAIQALLKPLRSRSDERRLVSLTSLLR